MEEPFLMFKNKIFYLKFDTIINNQNFLSRDKMYLTLFWYRLDWKWECNPLLKSNRNEHGNDHDPQIVILKRPLKIMTTLHAQTSMFNAVYQQIMEGDSLLLGSHLFDPKSQNQKPNKK